jgi:hypothetical protein
MAASEGVDLEWAIVEIARGSKLSRKYSKKVMDQANKCVMHIQKKLGKKFDIYHSDEKIPGYPRGIFGNPEPKTDIVIFAGSKKYFVSVKMEGGIQLASGEGRSTAKLFHAAAGNIKDATKKKKIQSLTDSLEGMPTRLLSENNLKRIMETKKKALIDEFIQNGKIRKDKSYELWSQQQKPKIMKAITDLATNDKAFFDALIYEALSGCKTLKDYPGASANSIISPTGFYMIDSAYINKVKSKIKVDVRAKSRSGITSIAFRIETRGSI